MGLSGGSVKDGSNMFGNISRVSMTTSNISDDVFLQVRIISRVFSNISNLSRTAAVSPETQSRSPTGTNSSTRLSLWR